MGSVFNWVANLTVVGKVWAALDGKKTYGAAALGIITSAAGLAGELAPLLSAHNTAGLIALIQKLPQDPSWLGLVASFGLLGLGHKADKAAAPVAPAP